MSNDLAAIESAKDTGLTPGTDQFNAYVSGYEAGVTPEAEAHKRTAGVLQAEVEKLVETLRECKTALAGTMRSCGSLDRRNARLAVGMIEDALAAYSEGSKP